VRHSSLTPFAVCIWLAAACSALPAAGQSLSLVRPTTAAAREGWQAVEQGRYRDADAAFERALAAMPDDTSALLGSAMVARQAGRLADARERLTRALTIDPSLTPASLMLGALLYEAGDLDGAIRVYDAALIRSPEQQELAAKLERWRKESEMHRDFQQTQGSHFTMLFEGPAAEELSRLALDILESELSRLTNALQIFPSEPITVVLYTKEQFRDVTRSPGWSGGLFDGRIKIPVGGSLQDRKELTRVLGHELTHAIVHTAAPRNLPTWLSEGIAFYLEDGGVDRARADMARGGAAAPLSAYEGSFARLPADRVRTAYASSALAVAAIVERVGMHALVGLATDLSGGTDLSTAFLERVQQPYADFQRTYLSGK
jgi:tetratricopeptide (TPR) repeat protein